MTDSSMQITVFRKLYYCEYHGVTHDKKLILDDGKQLRDWKGIYGNLKVDTETNHQPK